MFCFKRTFQSLLRHTSTFASDAVAVATIIVIIVVALPRAKKGAEKA